jgi:hypothetical protein
MLFMLVISSDTLRHISKACALMCFAKDSYDLTCLSLLSGGILPPTPAGALAAGSTSTSRRTRYSKRWWTPTTEREKLVGIDSISLTCSAEFWFVVR